MATERPAAERRGPARGRGRPPHPDILTPAEWRVLDLLREGLSNPEIAERLGLSRDTVKKHVGAILSKLGVSTREEAAAWQPEAGRRPWWAAGLGWLRPVTVGKAALIGAAVAVVAGLGVLAWGVLRESGDEQTLVVAASPTASFAPSATNAPSSTPGVRTSFPTVAPAARPKLLRGIYRISLGAGVPEAVLLKEGLASGSFSLPEVGTSPDGEWVGLFNARESGLDIASASTGDIQTLRSVEHVFSAAIGPGAARVFAYGSLEDQEGLFIIEVEADRATKVSDNYGSRMQWSPTGDKVAMVGGISGVGFEQSDSGIYIADAGTGALSLVGPGGRAFAWAPDGQSVAFTRTDGLFIANLSGDVSALGAAGQSAQTLAWSPDGAVIAYDEVTNPQDGFPLEWEIKVISTADGAVSEVGPGGMPAWSPDGERMAYVVNGAVHVKSMDGSERDAVVLDPQQPFLVSPRWLPDGSGIIAVNAPPVSGSIYEVDLTTGDESFIAHGYSPSLSPDGEWIAFIGSGSGGGLAGTSEVDVMRRDGTEIRSLGQFHWSDVVSCGPLEIVWSFDGRYIAYANSSSRISILSLDGSPVQAGELYGCGVSWSPDDLRLAYPTREAGPGMAVLDVGSGTVERLASGGDGLAWSPDGTRIAFWRSGDLYLAGEDGAGERRIMEGEPATAPVLSWSPNSREILTSVWRVSSAPAGGESFVTRVDTESGEVRDLTRGSSPVWSPDGRRIAFGRGAYPGEIYVMEADGGEPGLVSSGSEVAWGRDNDRILVVRE